MPSIGRRAFGAYDPEVWTIQTYLNELGFSPGAIDGLWGGKTLDAALTFRSWAGLGPAPGMDKASVVDEDFWTQIDRATASAGFEINLVPPSSAPGGAGVGPSVVDDLTRGSRGATATIPRGAPAGDSASSLLPLAILGLGADVAFGVKKRRR